jgi:hypothetical protein
MPITSLKQIQPPLPEIPYRDFALVANVPESLFEYLESEARRRDISLDLLTSIVLSEYAAKVRSNSRSKKARLPAKHLAT